MAGRALVTGGLGYVGGFLSQALAEAGWDVTVTGRTPPIAEIGTLQFVPAPLAPETNWATLCKGMDLIIHSAFQHEPGRYRGGEGDDPAGFWRANVTASAALIDAAHTAGVRHFAFLSSRAVYDGAPGPLPYREETPIAPSNLYGRCKAAIEEMLLSMTSDGFQPMIMRVTGVYGRSPFSGKDKWGPLVADYLGGQEIAPRAGTEVHGDDVAGALFSMLSGNEHVANVSDIIVDRSDLLARVAQRTGCANPLPAKLDDLSQLKPMDTSRLRDMGWTPRGEAGLAQAVEDILSHL